MGLYSNRSRTSRQNVARTSVTRSAAPLAPLYCTRHILSQRTVIWNLFVK